MGVRHSVYDKYGTLDYYKFSAEEYALIKEVWSNIEIEPYFHGTAYFKSFCETYPRYMKFFTLGPKLTINFDTYTTGKFSKIMESMGCILLDFNNKPKQLDRFVGYIAMVHKDMRLNEQDMRRFVSSFLNYLLRTYPMQMTAQCQEAMYKYLDSIVKKIFIKMETFRNYDIAQLDVTVQPKPWKRCTLFVDPTIFGKTKVYWDEWKKQWDERFDQWTAQDPSLLDPQSYADDEDDIALISKVDGDESEINILQQSVSMLLKRERTESDISSSRLELLSLSRTMNIGMNEVDSPYHFDEADDSQYDRSPRVSEGATSRERRRFKSIARDVSKPLTDPTTLDPRLQTDRVATDSASSEFLFKEDDKEIKPERDPEVAQVQASPKLRNTARERRRERLNVDLQ